MFLGYVFIALCESVLDEKEYSLGELSGANAKRAMLVLLIMTMHSFAEGLGVGVSWAGSKGSVQGWLSTSLLSNSSAAQRLASRLRSAIHHFSCSLAPISGGGARGLSSCPCPFSSSSSTAICCAAAVARA